LGEEEGGNEKEGEGRDGDGGLGDGEGIGGGVTVLGCHPHSGILLASPVGGAGRAVSVTEGVVVMGAGNGGGAGGVAWATTGGVFRVRCSSFIACASINQLRASLLLGSRCNASENQWIAPS
jgi:hypothetical protein